MDDSCLVNNVIAQAYGSRPQSHMLFSDVDSILRILSTEHSLLFLLILLVVSERTTSSGIISMMCTGTNEVVSLYANRCLLWIKCRFYVGQVVTCEKHISDCKDSIAVLQ